MIIDDGGHSNKQIDVSFRLLWPMVKPGGLYFMEDLVCGRGYPYDDLNHVAIADKIKDYMEQLMYDSRYPNAPDPKQHIKWGPWKNGYNPSVKAIGKWKMPEDVAWILCQAEACVLKKCEAGHYCRPVGERMYADKTSGKYQNARLKERLANVGVFAT